MNQMQRIVQEFTLYSMFGWIIEGLHQLCTQGKFIKPNFLLGPYKPMYGFAALILLGARQISQKAFLVTATIVPSCIEYLSGAWLKRDFGLTYWDYGKEKGHINGLVCVKFSIYWVILSYILVRLVHPVVESIAKRFHLSHLLAIFSGVMIGDMVYTLLKQYEKNN